MSNDNAYERLFKLWTMICKMVMDGVRDPIKVAEALQAIVDQGKVYLRRIYEAEVIKLGGVAVTIYEQVADGNFAQIFGSLGRDSSRICFASREAIDEFCRIHSDKIRTDGCGNFFLYKEGKNFFVAGVGVGLIAQPREIVEPLEYDIVWRACYRYRFFVPQQ